MKDHSPAADAVLVLNGTRYSLAAVLQNSKMAPMVTFKDNELNDPANTQFPEHVVAFEPKGYKDMAVYPTVLYKQHGKYTVLIGATHVVDAKADPKFTGELKGRLLSGPMLKKAKLETLQAIATQPEEEQPRRHQYGDNFNNRPRWRDEVDRR